MYEADVRAVRRVIRGLKPGEVIDDATARTIASWQEDPCARVRQFQLTGEIPDRNSHGLLRSFTASRVCDMPEEYAALGRYLGERAMWGSADPVPGWDRMRITGQERA